jgi:ring-1,2-phenylacetyl-CoA epoxidase subunit PaaE
VANARVILRLRGEEFCLEMEQGGRSILAVADLCGIELPVHCQVGWCTVCRCQLIEGEVTMAATIGLTPQELGAGIVLACCARPASPRVRLEFADPIAP